MCGRFYIASDQEDDEVKKIIEQINIQHKDTPELAAMKTGEVFPTDIVPAVTAQTPVLMKWGLPRFDGKGQIINARLETADEKPMFRKSFRSQRCLIPANNYFEWETAGAKKQKYAIGLDEPIFMAGLYIVDHSLSVPRFVILTRPAAHGIAFIHERMPVILSKDDRASWLFNDFDAQGVMSHTVEELSYSSIK